MAKNNFRAKVDPVCMTFLLGESHEDDFIASKGGRPTAASELNRIVAVKLKEGPETNFRFGIQEIDRSR